MANAFVQYELSPQTSLQAEYRYRNYEIGDIRLKFFPESIFPTQRFNSEQNNYRLGARHTFTPSSTLLAHFPIKRAISGRNTSHFLNPEFF